jgi:hypothetical protein
MEDRVAAFPRLLVVLDGRVPTLAKFRISLSTSRMNDKLPPAGENTTVKRGQERKQQVRSGLPADRGHSQNKVEGTVVTIATPSLGVARKPRYGCDVTMKQLQGTLVDTRRIETILSNGTSTSILPIQKRSVPSVVTSTERTKLYQNQANTRRLNRQTPTTVPCAPMGIDTAISAIQINSIMRHCTLKPVNKKTGQK